MSLRTRSPAVWPDIEAELTSILGPVESERLRRCWLRVATLLSLPADKLRAADRIVDLPGLAGDGARVRDRIEDLEYTLGVEASRDAPTAMTLATIGDVVGAFYRYTQT